MRRLTLILTTFALVALAAVVGNDMLAIEMPDNLPRAMQAQRALVATHPGDAAAHNDLANLLVLSGDLEGAEEAYRRAVELSPHEPAYHYNLALLLQQRGAFNRAADQYRQVVDLTPGNAWAHFQLGVIYEVKGLSRKAIDSYSRALQLDASLAFPDVNPSVIESDLLTEAMLRGYRRGLSVPQAPRIYREPGRISSLLIQTPGEGDPGTLSGGLEDEPEMATEEVPADPDTAAAASGEPDPQEGAAAGAADRTLSQGDLKDRPVNQASPQGRAGYRPPGSSSTAPRTVRTWRPPAENQGREQDAQPGARPTRPQQGSGTFGVHAGSSSQEGDEQGTGRQPERPTGRELVPGRRSPNGVDSTGRLEMVLEPPVSEQPA